MNKIGVEHDGRDRHFFFNSSLRHDAVKRLQVCMMFLVRCTHCVSLVYFSERKRDRDTQRERERDNGDGERSNSREPSLVDFHVSFSEKVNASQRFSC